MLLTSVFGCKYVDTDAYILFYCMFTVLQIKRGKNGLQSKTKDKAMCPVVPGTISSYVKLAA